MPVKNNKSRDKINQLQTKILSNLVQHVPFDGWSDLAVRQALKELGLGQSEWILAFPGGLVEAVTLYLQQSNAALAERLAKDDFTNLKIRQKVARGVQLKLEASNKELVRKTMGFLTLHPILSSKTLYDTVDIIWRAAGDQSLDWNFYSKRGLLSGVYLSTILFWLQDQSPDHTESWEFLNRRIENVMSIQKFKSKIAAMAPSP